MPDCFKIFLFGLDQKAVNSISELLNFLDIKKKLKIYTSLGELKEAVDHSVPQLIISADRSGAVTWQDVNECIHKAPLEIPLILFCNTIDNIKAAELINAHAVTDIISPDTLYRLSSLISRESGYYQLRRALSVKDQELIQLDTVARQSHNGVIITNKNGRIIWVNDAFEKLTGYKIDECYGKKPGAFVQGPETNPETIKKISRKLKEQEPFHEEILNYSKSGEKYWVKLDITPIFDKHNKLFRYVAIQEDITERKRHEELLNAINDISISLLDTNKLDVIARIITDKLITHFGFVDCVIYTMNSDGKSLTQVAATGPKEKINYHVDSPLTLKVGEGIVGSVAKTGKPAMISDTTTDIRYVVDDESRYSELTVPIIMDGKVLGIIDSEHPEKDYYSETDLKNLTTVAGVIATKFKAAQDQKEKELVRKELFEAENRLKSLTNNVPGVILRYIRYADGSDGALYVSDGIQGVFEIEPESAINNFQQIWDQILPEDIESLAEAINDSIKNMTDFECVYRIKTPSKKVKWMYSKGTTSSHPDGAVLIDAIITDITKDKEIELALSEKEKQLTHITGNMNAVVVRYVLNDDGITGKFTYASAKVKDIFGVEPSDILQDENSFWNLIHPDDLDLVNNNYNKAVKELSPFQIEYRIKMKNGVLKWIEAQGTASTLENGTIFSDTIFIDITERKVKDQIIKENEERLRTLTNNLPGVILSYHQYEGDKTTIEYISAQAENLFEITAHEILEDNDKLIDLVFPEDLEEMSKTIRESAKNSSMWEFVYRIKTKSGKVKYLQAIGSPRSGKNNNVPYIIWDTLILDITNEVMFKESLTDAIERLNEAQEIAMIGDWTIDMITGETYVSPIVKKIYEVEHDFVMGEGVTFYKEGYDRNRINYVVNRAIEEGIPYTEDLRLITKKGNERWVRANGKALFSDGKCVKLFGTLMDITSEKEYENSIKEINRLLLQAQNIGKIGDWHYSTNTDRIHWSDQMYKIYERDPASGPPSIDNIKSKYYGKDQNAHNEALEKCLNELSELDITVELITERNNTKHVRIVGVPVIEDGSVASINGIVQDITDEYVATQKVIESEQLLKENEFRLEAAVAGADLGVWDTNFELGTNVVNNRWFEMIGYKYDPTMSTLDFFNEIIHPDDKNLPYQEIRRIENGGDNYFELTLRLKAKDNSYHYILDRGRVVEFNEQGKAVRAIGTHLDITEQIILEKELKESEFRLETAVNGANLGIWDANIRDGINVANDRWFEMFGYKPEEIEDSYEFFFSIVHPEDVDLILSEIGKIERGEKESFEVIVRVKSKSGEYITILDKGTGLEFDSDGHLIRMIGTHLDITKQLELQSELQRSIDEKNVLLSEIHHRVKNNLAIVSGLLEIKAIESDNKELSSTLMDMGQRIKSIAGVHEQLYNNNNFIEIPILKYINSLISNINATMFNKKNVAFSINISPDIQININQAVPIGLLVNELITNSFKYAFIDEAHPKIELRLISKEDTYYFTYSDNGTGFDEKVFKEAKSLGLTLIKTLLAQLEADYNFETDNGFRLEFEFEPKDVGAHAVLKV